MECGQANALAIPTLQAIMYARDNIMAVMNFIEDNTGEDNSNYLAYNAKVNEFSFYENGKESKIPVRLATGCLIVKKVKGFKVLFLELN